MLRPGDELPVIEAVFRGVVHYLPDEPHLALVVRRMPEGVDLRPYEFDELPEVQMVLPVAVFPDSDPHPGHEQQHAQELRVDAVHDPRHPRDEREKPVHPPVQVAVVVEPRDAFFEDVPVVLQEPQYLFGLIAFPDVVPPSGQGFVGYRFHCALHLWSGLYFSAGFRYVPEDSEIGNCFMGYSYLRRYGVKRVFASRCAGFSPCLLFLCKVIYHGRRSRARAQTSPRRRRALCRLSTSMSPATLGHPWPSPKGEGSEALSSLYLPPS